MIERKGDGLPIEKPTFDAGGMGGGLDSLDGMIADVEREAAAVLNPGAAPVPGQPVDMGPDYMKGAAGLVDLASAALDGYAPGAGWNDDKRGLMAASIAPVLEKYGWDVESKMPCELVALFVCGPALYQSAKIVALKITTDRVQIERAARGIADPHTIKGAAAAESGAQAAPEPSTQVDASTALNEALATAPVFPAM